MGVINDLIEKQIEERLWQQWLVMYPNMTKDTFVSFNDFKFNIFKERIETKTQKSKDEILEKVNKIRKGRTVTDGDI